MTEPVKPAATAIVDPQGRVVEADAANIPRLLDSGYRLANDQEIQTEHERQQYGEGFGNEAAAFGEGALSGATVGLSDLAAKYVAPEYAADLAKRRQYNETAAALGEGAGVLGATLVSGGLLGEAGLAARGAQAVTAPARGLLAVGEGLTQGAARLLGTEGATGVLGQAARQAAAYGVGGAAEGALFGAAKTVTDDLLNDHELSAERIKMGAGEGALYGGLLGSGMGFTGSVLGSGARKIGQWWERSNADREATRALDEAIDATPGVGASAEAEQAAQTLTAEQTALQQIGVRSDDKVMAEMTMGGADPKRASLLSEIRDMAEQENAHNRFRDMAKDAASEIVQDGEEFRRLQDEIATYANRGQKRNAVKSHIEAAPPDWTTANVDRVYGAIDDTEKRLLKIREDSTALEPAQHAAMKEATDLATEIKGKLRGFTGRKAGEVAGPAAPDALTVRMDADAIADVQDLHDKFKSALGRAAKKADRGSSAPASAGGNALRREAMAHRALLEDETLYGKGATELQRITNAAESEALLYTRAFDHSFGLPEGQQTMRAGKHVTGATFDALQTFDKVDEFSHPKIRGFLESAGEDPQTERTFVLGLRRQADNVKAKSEFYSMPPEIKAKAARASELADKMIERYRDVRNTRAMAEEYAQRLERLKQLPVYGEQLGRLKIAFGRALNLTSSLTTEARATSSGGGIRTAVSAAIRGESAIGKAGRGIGTWLRKASKVTGEAAEKAGRAATQSAKGVPLLGVSMSVDDPASVEKLIRNVGAMQDPQSDERRAMRVGAFGLRQEHPELAAALEQHTQRVADFLADKAGGLSAVAKPGDPFGRLRQPRHSAAQAAKLARYVQAATNPGGALERIGQGQVLREDVETLQALYPRMYQRMVSEVLMSLGSVDQLPSYEARVRLSHLLNAPADPSMRPERAAALQELARSGAQPDAQQQQDNVGQPVLSPSQRRPPTKLGRMYATQVDRQSTGGALDG